jgi:hypothetical protein
MARLASVLTALLLLCAPLQAQTLRDRVNGLFTFGTCGEPLCLTVTPAHGRHFIPELVQGNENLIGFLSDAIGASIGSIPLSSASGGSTFQFVNGAPVETAVSAGPIFGERALTLGRRRLLLGANVTRFAFQSLRGVPLNDIEFNFTHQNVGSPALGDPEFENDVLQVRTALDFDLTAGTVYGTYGLLDWLDLGVAVPIVHARFSGTSRALLFPFEGTATPHELSPGSITAQAADDGSATGIGDVAVRVKAKLPTAGRVGAAILGDVRLPTGDEENFLGSGYTTVRALGILSARLRDFTPHLNAGFLFRSADDVDNAVLVTAGFDQLISPDVTLSFDVLSEWEVGSGGLSVPGPVEFSAPYQRSVEATTIPDMRDDVVNATLGAKILLGGGVTAVANGLAPLNRGGLRPDWGITLGLERSF